MCKHRFGVQLLKNPPLCSNTIQACLHSNITCIRSMHAILQCLFYLSCRGVNWLAVWPVGWCPNWRSFTDGQNRRVCKSRSLCSAHTHTHTHREYIHAEHTHKHKSDWKWTQRIQNGQLSNGRFCIGSVAKQCLHWAMYDKLKICHIQWTYFITNWTLTQEWHWSSFFMFFIL